MGKAFRELTFGPPENSDLEFVLFIFLILGFKTTFILDYKLC